MIYLTLIPVFFYVLSGICDAIIDTLSHHFGMSVFYFMDHQFWDPNISWKNKYVNGDPVEGYVKWKLLGISFTKPVQLTDGFHFVKMIREGSNILAITTALIVPFVFSIFYTILFFIILSAARNNSFSLFYNKILISKK